MSGIERDSLGFTSEEYDALCRRAYENLPRDTPVTPIDVDAILTWCLPEALRILDRGPRPGMNAEEMVEFFKDLLELRRKLESPAGKGLPDFYVRTVVIAVPNTWDDLRMEVLGSLWGSNAKVVRADVEKPGVLV